MEFRRLWDSARKQNAKIEEYGASVLQLQIPPGVSVTHEELMKFLLVKVHDFAKHVVEYSIHKPIEKDRFFYDVLITDESDLMLGFAFYFGRLMALCPERRSYE